MSSMSRAQLADMGDIGAHWHTMSLPPCTPRDFGGGAIGFLSARHHSGPNFFPKLTNPLKISRPANLWVKEPPSILRIAEIWGVRRFLSGMVDSAMMARYLLHCEGSIYHSSPILADHRHVSQS